MCPRRRRIHDHFIAETAGQILIDLGHAALTFAEVSKRCGLAPPTLVQRFGTRERMLAGAVADLRTRIPAAFTATTLVAALQTLGAHQLALSTLEGTPETSAWSLELRKQISFCLSRMVEAGELPRCDVAQLARLIQFAFAGAVSVAAIEGADPAPLISSAIEAQVSNFV